MVSREGAEQVQDKVLDQDEEQEVGGAPPCTAVPPSQGLQTGMCFVKRAVLKSLRKGV